MLETIRFWFINNWFILLIIFFLVGMMLYGHDKGFFRLAVSACALIITVFLVNITLPHVTSWIKTHTGVTGAIQNVLMKNVGIDGIDETKTDSVVGMDEAISQLNLSSDMKSSLNKYNTSQMWEKLGVNKFKEYVAGYLSNIILNDIGFVIMFIIIWILLHIGMKFADIFTKLPIIHGLNQIAGAVLGLLEALVFVWIGFLVLRAFAGTSFGADLMGRIEDNAFLSFLYINNPVSMFLTSMVEGGIFNI